MIKDFIPARTSLASGLVVKQHLLERNKYQQPSVQREEILLTGSIDMVAISGGAAGVFNKFNGLSTSPVGTTGLGPDNIFNVTQSWNETYSSLSGSITQLHDSQAEFYNGEFSGSTLLITNGELNAGCDEFKNVSPIGAEFQIRSYSSLIYNFDDFITILNDPLDGYIQTWFQDSDSNTLPAPNPTS